MGFINKIWSQKKEKAHQKGALANARELLRDKLTGDGKVHEPARNFVQIRFWGQRMSQN